MSYRMTARDMDAPETTITGGMPEFAPMGSDWRREPGHVRIVLQREDDDQAAAVHVDTADLHRKGSDALRLFLAFLAFLCVAGIVGGMDRETRRQDLQTRAER